MPWYTRLSQFTQAVTPAFSLVVQYSYHCGPGIGGYRGTLPLPAVRIHHLHITLPSGHSGRGCIRATVFNIHKSRVMKRDRFIWASSPSS
ncbi:hypothetical protein Pcinc_017946 [Petrolisthes cinctipes]|uniref:Uncharacterized protein n=1 Tax=Petrolisthes cinctipes TaxID=88211 RepID=A0AAE1FQF4_PETCI|nr:hypothetical protein Pcinc_017946 [Petrolisthes cinctipes]